MAGATKQEAGAEAPGDAAAAAVAKTDGKAALNNYQRHAERRRVATGTGSLEGGASEP